MKPLVQELFVQIIRDNARRMSDLHNYFIIQKNDAIFNNRYTFHVCFKMTAETKFAIIYRRTPRTDFFFTGKNYKDKFCNILLMVTQKSHRFFPFCDFFFLIVSFVASANSLVNCASNYFLPLMQLLRI